MSVAEAPSFQPARVSPVTRSGRAIVGRSVELEAISAALDEGLEALIGISLEGRLRDGKLSGAIRQGAIETPLVLQRAK